MPASFARPLVYLYVCTRLHVLYLRLRTRVPRCRTTVCTTPLHRVAGFTVYTFTTVGLPLPLVYHAHLRLPVAATHTLTTFLYGYLGSHACGCVTRFRTCHVYRFGFISRRSRVVILHCHARLFAAHIQFTFGYCTRHAATLRGCTFTPLHRAHFATLDGSYTFVWFLHGLFYIWLPHGSRWLPRARCAHTLPSRCLHVYMPDAHYYTVLHALRRFCAYTTVRTFTHTATRTLHATYTVTAFADCHAHTHTFGSHCAHFAVHTTHARYTGCTPHVVHHTFRLPRATPLRTVPGWFATRSARTCCMRLVYTYTAHRIRLHTFPVARCVYLRALPLYSLVPTHALPRGLHLVHTHVHVYYTLHIAHTLHLPCVLPCIYAVVLFCRTPFAFHVLLHFGCRGSFTVVTRLNRDWLLPSRSLHTVAPPDSTLQLLHSLNDILKEGVYCCYVVTALLLTVFCYIVTFTLLLSFPLFYIVGFIPLR